MLRILDVKNVNKRKHRLTPVKLESKKQDKKVVARLEGSGGKFQSNDTKKPLTKYNLPITLQYLLDSLIYINT